MLRATLVPEAFSRHNAMASEPHRSHLEVVAILSWAWTGNLFLRLLSWKSVSHPGPLRCLITLICMCAYVCVLKPWLLCPSCFSFFSSPFRAMTMDYFCKQVFYPLLNWLFKSHFKKRSQMAIFHYLLPLTTTNLKLEDFFSPLSWLKSLLHSQADWR